MSTHASASRALNHPLLVLLSGNGGVALLTLMRNIFAARLIGVENFGIAASFAIMVSAIEMITTLGAQQLIVQDAEGDTVELQASLHLVQLGRGIVGAIALYLLAEPVAQFLGTPSIAWAYRTLALAPLMAGLIHLDAWRYQRTHRFAPAVCIQIGPAILTLLLIWPLYTKFGDYRVLLIAAVIQSAGVLLMSRLFAERRYLVALNINHLRRVYRFGWPLALNGILLLAVFHGEKLLVGHLRGPASLAVLAMGFTLTLTPALIIGRSLQSYALPLLSGHKDDPIVFRERANEILQLCTVVGILLGTFLYLATPLVPIMLGSGFATVTPLIPMLAVLHGIRVAKTGVSIVALAKGATANAVLGNLPRIMALPLIYHALRMGGSLNDILWIATAAEAMGLLVAFVALRWNMGTRPY